MRCDGCGNEDAVFIRHKVGKDINVEYCDKCGGVSNVNVPDVYFKEPYVDPHLIDTKNPAEFNGVLITSRRMKAERMRAHDVEERGDRRHGALNR